MWAPQKSGRIKLHLFFFCSWVHFCIVQWNMLKKNLFFFYPSNQIACRSNIHTGVCCALGPVWVSSHSCGWHGHYWCVQPQQTVSFQVCFTSVFKPLARLILYVWNLIPVYVICIIKSCLPAFLQTQRCRATKSRSSCWICQQSCSRMCGCPVSLQQQHRQLDIYHYSCWFLF